MYTVNECFYSLQGEGVRAGTPNIFVRFSGCNMRCAQQEGEKSPGGFDCDTEFVAGRRVTKEALLSYIVEIGGACKNLVLTGGEPLLQVDKELVEFFHENGYYLAIETNGSLSAEGLGLDWITVSPKVAEHCIRQAKAHEVKYVRAYGQAIPRTCVQAENKLISPAFNGTVLDKKTLEWCISLVKDNPTWRLSVQLHKGWGIL